MISKKGIEQAAKGATKPLRSGPFRVDFE